MSGLAPARPLAREAGDVHAELRSVAAARGPECKGVLAFRPTETDEDGAGIVPSAGRL